MPFGTMATDRLQGINYERMREYRLARTKKMMEEDGIDVLITWEPWNLRYVSSVYAPMPTRWRSDQFVILPKNGDPHVFAYTCYSPEAMREEMPWLKGKIWSAPPGGKVVTKAAALEPFMKIALGIISEAGLSGGTVGLDACPNFYMYEGEFVKNGFTVTDPAFAMFRARSIKNPDEVACVRLACYSADAAFNAMQQAIRPGVRENELQAVGMEALYAFGADETMEFVVATGARVNPLHIDFTDRIVRPGDYVVVDINGNSFQGYKSCYYRTFICGEADEGQNEGFEMARKLMYDGMEQIKPGKTTDDVLDVWPSGPEFWGYSDRKMLGGMALAHGIGLSLHEYPMFGVGGPSGEKPPRVAFEEGMCLAIETYYGDKDHSRRAYGTRLEECVAVTGDGYELLTRYPVQSIIECPL